MQVNTFTSINPSMGQTRTFEDFSKWIGQKPTRFGVIARMFEQNTAEYITEGLGNLFFNDYKKSRFQSINSMYYEWEIETNDVKRIALADTPIGDGAHGTEITFAMSEPWYNMNDIFEIEDTKQQFFVKAGPIRKADNYLEYQCQIVSDSFNDSLEGNPVAGTSTRYIGNAHPELHEFGFTKYQSNTSKFRNYLTTIRVDDSASSLFTIHEDMFINLGKGKGSGEDSEQIYKLEKLKANLLKNFNEACNNMLLLARTNVTADGKPTLYDAQNRPITIGEGIIPQIERYANKYMYNDLSLEIFNAMIDTLSEKADQPTGNTYTLICNEIFWRQANQKLAKFLTDNKTDGAYLWSRKANGGTGGYIKVGATYNAYEWAGNTVVIRVERALSREYPNKGFAMAIDLTADSTSNMPAVAMFTLRGGQCIQNWIAGVGGLDGLSSGEVSSPVAGVKYTVHGYKGVAVFNPYRSCIIREA